MGGACSTYGGDERRTQGFLWENLRERDHLKDPTVDGRIIFRWGKVGWGGGMDWIDLAQGRDRWRAPVNAVMNFRVP